MDKIKVLWTADACCHTGFARVTHAVVGRLVQREYNVRVLGINYTGDPHPYPYLIYPARSGGDILGLYRIANIYNLFNPDIVVINNDAWNVSRFLEQEIPGPVIAYMPVDAPNLDPSYVKPLNKLKQVLSYTYFGKKELRTAGLKIPVEVIPHGIATQIFYPMNKAEARKKVFRLDDDLSSYFIVGNVNRNQPRKRLDLTIEYFSEWVHSYHIPKNVMLLLHCFLGDTHGYNLLQLANHYKIEDRIIITPSSFPEDELRAVYNSLDLQISTTTGEGFGLTTIEGMACGIPQLVPEYAALAEWPDGSVVYADVKDYQVSPKVNTIGGVVSRNSFIQKLNWLYENQTIRDSFGARALKRARDPIFSWDRITERIAGMIDYTVRKTDEAVNE